PRLRRGRALVPRQAPAEVPGALSVAASLGLILANRAVVLGAVKARDLLDIAADAERSGVFDAVWVGDSLLAKPRLESVTLLSALAGVTSRVRLAVGCLATFVHRHPVLFAQQWTSLDVLSRGRAWLVVCLGGPSDANAAQAAVERAYRRVARFADGWMTNKISPEEFRAQFARVRAMASEEGRDPSRLGSALYHNVNLNEDRVRALEEAKAFLEAYYTATF